MKIEFASSKQSTLGVEWEPRSSTPETGELASVANQVLRGVAARHPELNEDDEHLHIKQELLLNTVELVTGICTTVAEAKADLSSSLAAVRDVTDPMGVEVFAPAATPSARPSCSPSRTRNATPSSLTGPSGGAGRWSSTASTFTSAWTAGTRSFRFWTAWSITSRTSRRSPRPARSGAARTPATPRSAPSCSSSCPPPACRSSSPAGRTTRPTCRTCSPPA